MEAKRGMCVSARLETKSWRWWMPEFSQLCDLESSELGQN
jgi:hypothetical protein